MSENRKQLVLDVLDGKERERVPSGFWFHFLEDEIHADAFRQPELEEKLLAGELDYIEGFKPDFVKIMTDGFFPYPREELKHIQSAKELYDIEPLPEDSPYFSQQVEYAKKVTGRLGEKVASF